MRFLKPTRGIDLGDESRLTESVRELTAGEPGIIPPAEEYWAGLRARTNERIDEATSPKALTISWALRVALPGVLAIASFMLGLRYFVPMHPKGALPLQAVVLAMPDDEVDTMLADPSRVQEAISIADLGGDPFALGGEEVGEYLIASANVGSITETLDDTQVTDVLTVLGSSRTDPIPQR